MAAWQFCGEDVGGSSVADFYAQKSVFITGGTGFLGKVIMEKLLYSCPQLDKLYVLVRNKRKLNIQQRIEKLLDLPVFDRLREEKPQQFKKIVPIFGDVTLPNLGIKPEDETELLEKVSVVIHTAAIVKFNEALKIALDVNYEGTKKVLDLCGRMKKIQVLVYISTAYTNTQNKVIEEQVYPTSINVEDLYEKLDGSGNGDSKFLNGFPNTYCLTKFLSESLVRENRNGVPTVVIKPSIVTASKSEPIEGWIDSWAGSAGLLYYIAKGHCRTVMSNRKNILDLIPVDYVSNLTIIAAAKCHTCKEVEVFNSCSSSINPVTIGETTDRFIEHTVRKRNHDILFPWVYVTTWLWLYWILILFTEIIPACIVDFCLIQFMNPPKFTKTHGKMSLARNIAAYFTKNSWIIKNDKARALAASLTSRDAATFPCDPSDICWPTYLTTYIDGIQRYLVESKQKCQRQEPSDVQGDHQPGQTLISNQEITA